MAAESVVYDCLVCVRFYSKFAAESHRTSYASLHYLVKY